MDGVPEYHTVVSDPMPYDDLPPQAVHRTGGKGEYYLVDMEPDLPAYCRGDSRDAQGNPKKAFNFFDANGYYIYAVDERLKKAEQAVATMNTSRDYDWKKIATVALCVVIVAAVVWRFMG